MTDTTPPDRPDSVNNKIDALLRDLARYLNEWPGVVARTNLQSFVAPMSAPRSPEELRSAAASLLNDVKATRSHRIVHRRLVSGQRLEMKERPHIPTRFVTYNVCNVLWGAGVPSPGSYYDKYGHRYRGRALDPLHVALSDAAASATRCIERLQTRHDPLADLLRPVEVPSKQTLNERIRWAVEYARGKDSLNQ